MDDSIEVCWDHDSPTPAVWKRLQGPCTNEEDAQCSPKLVRAKRKIPPQSRIPVDDYPRFEQSLKEANQIINALKQASNEGETSNTNIVRRLVIPELPEEESDDERNPQTTPFKDCLPNTSLDVIFEMSGNGDDLAPTVRSGNVIVPKFSNGRLVSVSPTADDWADDDIFNSDALISHMDQVLCTTPAKSAKQSFSSHKLTDAQRRSTPSNVVTKTVPRTAGICDNGNSKSDAKGFLDFFMNDGKPVKPSPKKDKRVKRNNYQFVTKVERSKTALGNASKSGCNSGPVQNNVKQPSAVCRVTSNATNAPVTNCMNGSMSKPSSAATKLMDTSIPLDILEGLIEDDSWMETDDEKDSNAQQKNKDFIAKPQNNPANDIKTRSNVNSGQGISKRVLSFASEQQKHTRPRIDPCGIGNTTDRYKFRKTKSGQPTLHQSAASREQAAAPCIGVSKKLQEIKKSTKCNVSSDGFSSDDEDLLLEAVAITESQQSSNSKGPSPAPSTILPKMSATNVGSGVPTGPRPRVVPVPKLTSFPSPAASTILPKMSATNVRSGVPTGSRPRAEPVPKLTSFSQMKCTASEIERKKKMAMEKRMQRVKERNRCHR